MAYTKQREMGWVDRLRVLGFGLFGTLGLRGVASRPAIRHGHTSPVRLLQVTQMDCAAC